MATKSDVAGPVAASAVSEPVPVALTKKEIERYSRHLIMPEVGMEGQLKLKQAKVLCIGTGGLGAPLGLYLAAAGVGRIGLVDFDKVDDSNLQRQILFSTKDVGRPKIEAAADRLHGLNPERVLIAAEAVEYSVQPGVAKPQVLLRLRRKFAMSADIFAAAPPPRPPRRT